MNSWPFKSLYYSIFGLCDKKSEKTDVRLEIGNRQSVGIRTRKSGTDLKSAKIT